MGGGAAPICGVGAGPLQFDGNTDLYILTHRRSSNGRRRCPDLWGWRVLWSR